ncbi:hypothetical protein D3C87_1302900 [compost metagenome]
MNVEGFAGIHVNGIIRDLHPGIALLGVHVDIATSLMNENLHATLGTQTNEFILRIIIRINLRTIRS